MDHRDRGLLGIDPGPALGADAAAGGGGGLRAVALPPGAGARSGGAPDGTRWDAEVFLAESAHESRHRSLEEWVANILRMDEKVQFAPPKKRWCLRIPPYKCLQMLGLFSGGIIRNQGFLGGAGFRPSAVWVVSKIWVGLEPFGLAPILP